VITLEGSDELDYGFARWGSDKWIVLPRGRRCVLERKSDVLRKLTTALQDVPGVASVASLDTAAAVDTGPFGPYVRPLVPDEIGSDPGLREAALANGFVRDQLVSRDGRLLLVAVQLEAGELDSTAQERRCRARSTRACWPRPSSRSTRAARRLTGVQPRARRLNRRDNALFTPLALGMIAVVLPLLFAARSPLVALGVDAHGVAGGMVGSACP
jgi:hypothetical protein